MGFVGDPRWSKENDVTIINILQTSHLHELTMHMVSANGINFESRTCEFITFTQLELERKHHRHPYNVL